MRILISNDDGVDAIGIKTLANALFSKGHEITVVAPNGNRSGFSHSLTVRKGMRFYKDIQGYEDGIRVFSLDGTPADCVKFSVSHFGDEAFDLVVSGINEGPNMGVDIMYSGTVGAATEGAFHGINSFAISLATHENAINFGTCAKVLIDNMDRIIELNHKNIVWNINCPNIKFEQLKGVRFTKIGRVLYDDTYYDHDIDGYDGYILDGLPKKDQSTDLETDVGAVFGGYASITPLLVDRTNYSLLKELSE